MVPTTREVVARSCSSRYTSTAAISVRIPNPMVIEIMAQTVIARRSRGTPRRCAKIVAEHAECVTGSNQRAIAALQAQVEEHRGQQAERRKSNRDGDPEEPRIRRIATQHDQGRQVPHQRQQRRHHRFDAAAQPPGRAIPKQQHQERCRRSARRPSAQEC